MTAPAARPTLSLRPLYVALYAVAFGFIVPSTLEFLLVSYPYRFGDMRWRFGAVGLLFNSVLLLPLVGLTIIAIAAVLLEHRRVARIASVLALVAAAAVVLLMPLFVLDYVQLRKIVSPPQLRAYDYTSLKAMLVAVLMFVIAIFVGIGGLRATRLPKVAAARRAPRKSANPVVVGGGTAEATPTQG
ncbi:MAG TPA: hypothetical protein VFS08_01065 [Gemmatimonadaceae bacterium]|nr:hypothetical protein [Gemmatimonadaceae bacterium]